MRLLVLACAPPAQSNKKFCFDFHFLELCSLFQFYFLLAKLHPNLVDLPQCGILQCGGQKSRVRQWPAPVEVMFVLKSLET
jgi:hypothetical protein